MREVAGGLISNIKITQFSQQHTDVNAAGVTLHSLARGSAILTIYAPAREG